MRATSTTQSWSPATGTVSSNSVFMFGLTGTLSSGVTNDNDEAHGVTIYAGACVTGYSYNAAWNNLCGHGGANYDQSWCENGGGLLEDGSYCDPCRGAFGVACNSSTWKGDSKMSDTDMSNCNMSA